MPVDFDADPQANTNRSATVVVLELGSDATHHLLDGRQRPEHVIITALAHGLSTWTGSRTVLLDVLSHGRDAALDGVNLSRTIGFTLSYNPLVLSHETWDGTRATLEAVTAQIKGGPEGFSFELLRFLAADHRLRERFSELPRAEVLFNYAGLAASQRDEALWKEAAEPTGPSDGPSGLRQHPIAVRATLEPNLRLTFIYSTELHEAATIEALATEVVAALRRLLEASLVAS